MKRNENLLALSRDHHHGLLLAWKIRQGLKLLAEPRIIADYIAKFFAEALLPHFEEEENQILTYLPDLDPLKQRTLTEHENIAGLIRQLDAAGNVNPAELLKIAGYVDEHIRFEERELFPYLEELLTPGQLKEIGVAIAINHKPFAETFPIEFWRKQVQ